MTTFLIDDPDSEEGHPIPVEDWLDATKNEPPF